MPVLFGGFSLLLLALWIYCLFDVITSDPARIRNLPKIFWLVIVLILPDVGAISWLLLGRPRVAAVTPKPAPKVAAGPDDDEEFLRGLRARAEEQRRRAKEQETD